jgi:hypothetical protein
MRFVGLLLLWALILSPALGFSQVVQPAGSATSAVNWQSARSGATSFTDSLQLDLDCNGVADVVFFNNAGVPTGVGQPTSMFFGMSLRSAGFEVACDINYSCCPRRFQALDPIGPGISWQQNFSASYFTSLPIDYTISGNGGTGGLGVFRDGLAGLVVVRQQAGSTVRYWWIQVEPRWTANPAAGPFYRRVNYYGSTTLLPAAATVQPVAKQFKAYPNPANNQGWTLVGGEPGTYQLYDVSGRLLGEGNAMNGAVIPAAKLPAGWYVLRFQQADGDTRTLQLQKK